MTELRNSNPGVQIQQIAWLPANVAVVRLGHNWVEKVPSRAFKDYREHAKRSDRCVATMGKIEMGEEDDTVNSETTSALGGTREVLNEVDCPGELMNEFRGHRGQVYPEVEEKQAG